MTTPLIGRGRELDALRSAVAEVASGAPAAVLLTGLPGVGKTRLAREALRLAAVSGFATCAGRAHVLGQDVAYAPLVAALGPPVRDADEQRRAALVGDLPQLGLVLSGLGLADPTPLGDPQLERARLVDGLSRLTERLARERPLAILIDDVHAADSSTTAFLHYLVEVVTEHPILLVLAARPDDPGDDRVASLARDLTESTWSSVQLAVRPMSVAEATALVAELLGRAVDEQLASMIVERCAGRPLFIEALARTLVEEDRLAEVDGVLRLNVPDMPLPDAVRDQLRIRLTGLRADERGVLNTLAVADNDLDHVRLARAAQLPPLDAMEALDRLHARGLLATTSSGARYDLVHGLLRDTLVAELSPAATARLHAQLARVLIADEPSHPRTAEHVLQAGGLVEPDQALEHLVRGAEHASSLGAGEDAVRYLRAATSAAAQLSDAQVLADLQADLALALRRTGDMAEAEATWRSALARYESLATPDAIARVQQELGMLKWSMGSLDDASAHFASAEAVLSGLEPSPAHAKLLFNKVITASRIGDTDTVVRTAHDLRELAGQLASPALIAQSFLTEAVLDYAATDYLAMVEHNLQALAAAERSRDPLLIIRAHDQLSVAAASQVDLAGLRKHSEASLQQARDLGALFLQPWPRSRLAVVDLLRGDWDAALRTTSEVSALALRYGEQRGSVSTSAGHAWVLVHRGRLDDAQQYLERARRDATPMLEKDRNIFSIVAIADATLALAQGDPSRAVTWAAQLNDTTGGWMPLIGLAVLGEARALSGDLDGAAEIVERFAKVISCATVAPEAFAHWVGGLAAAHAGDAEPAVDQLRHAADAFDSLGLPFYSARAQLTAACAGAPADPRPAVELARRALTTFDRLGAPIQAQQARELLRSLGVVPSRGRARRSASGPLSARELEVARAVASGLSNAGVATALFISPRTVTTHLDRIYTRLGLSSRAALTRYLADSGLLDDPSPGASGAAANT